MPRPLATAPHVAVCVCAAVIETLTNHALATADIADSDNGHQHLTAARALRALNRIRRHRLTANSRQIQITTRCAPLQTRALAAIRADTRTSDKAAIT